MPSKQNLRRLIAGVSVLATVILIVWMIGVFRAQPVTAHPFFDEFDPDGTVIVSDVGKSGLWPENTLAAIRGSRALGLNVVAVDVRLSSDGVPVLMNDATVDRTTDGTGLVAEKTSDQLGLLDAGYHFQSSSESGYPFRGLGIRVPTLEQVMREFSELGILLFLRDDDPRLVQSVGMLVREYERTNRSLVYTGSEHMAEVVRENFPEIASFTTNAEARTFAMLQRLLSSRTFTPEAQALLLDRTTRSANPSSRFVNDAYRQGLRVAVRTSAVGAEVAELVERGVHFIITPLPDLTMASIQRL